MIIRYYPYTLTLGSPVVLPQPGGDPNSAESIDFIPGSAVRGAVARVLTDASPHFHQIILSGDVRYLNAYVLLRNQRCLPVPSSFRMEKYTPRDHAVCHDLAGYTGGRAIDEEGLDWPSEQLVRLPARYLSLSDPTPAAASVNITATIHHQRDRKVGKPTERVGALFRYEALDEGQQFGGLIVCRGPDAATVESLAEQVRGALSETILLGRSRRAGYGGLARLEWGDPRSREVEGQRVLTGAQPAGTLLRALLVSDYVGRDSRTGQTDPSAWVDEVVAALGGRVKPLRRAGEFRLTGGYNRKWGLELPQALVQRAGAVAVLSLTDPASAEELLGVEDQGLGERRVEGFGRIVFFPDGGRRWSPGSGPRSERTSPPPGDPPRLLGTMERRLLRDKVDARVLEVASELAGSAQGGLPSRSLLGRLRVPLRLPPSQALTQLSQWLGYGANALRLPARRQLQRCRVQASQSQRRSFADWLQTLVAGELDLSGLLNYPELAQRYNFTSESSAHAWLAVMEERNRVRVLLVEAVLAAMARQRGQPGGTP